MKDTWEKIVLELKNTNKTISFMESCTGGFLANELTNVSGASEVLKVSLVTYSDEYKIKFGVDKNIIKEYNVYSINTAKEMAKKVSEFANSDFGIGVTGQLGNEGINKVYYSIYNKETNEYINKELIAESTERKEKKEEISQEIINTFINSKWIEINS